MTVKEAIQTLSELREKQRRYLSVQDEQAIGIAMVIMIALIPSQSAMIDALIDMKDAGFN
ncbi:hypothetical protein ES705_27777 [subsurface metagenome]